MDRHGEGTTSKLGVNLLRGEQTVRKLFRLPGPFFSLLALDLLESQHDLAAGFKRKADQMRKEPAAPLFGAGAGPHLESPIRSVGVEERPDNGMGRRKWFDLIDHKRTLLYGQCLRRPHGSRRFRRRNSSICSDATRLGPTAKKTTAGISIIREKRYPCIPTPPRRQPSRTVKTCQAMRSCKRPTADCSRTRLGPVLGGESGLSPFSDAFQRFRRDAETRGDKSRWHIPSASVCRGSGAGAGPSMLRSPRNSADVHLAV